MLLHPKISQGGMKIKVPTFKPVHPVNALRHQWKKPDDNVNRKEARTGSYLYFYVPTFESVYDYQRKQPSKW